MNPAPPARALALSLGLVGLILMPGLSHATPARCGTNGPAAAALQIAEVILKQRDEGQKRLDPGQPLAHQIGADDQQ